jgi:glycosyltransferase involved in cell wall biosynthesis
LIYRLERRILHVADLVLTDTQLHAKYFVETFALPEAKICSLPVGAIENEARVDVSPLPDVDAFRVLFYGSFLPLHGVEVILEAASRLSDLPIFFDFIGGNTKRTAWLRDQCERMKIVRYSHRSWVPFEELLHNEIPRANLCLGGPFGGTPQARRVVTGKTSQCLALAKATVIGRIDEQDGFVDRDNCLLVDQNNPGALAETIRWAYENRTCLETIGAHGRALYLERLSIDVIAKRLLHALRNLSSTSALRDAS